MPVVPGSGGLQVLAKAQDDGALLRVDSIQAATDPDRREQYQNTAQALAEAGRTLPAAETAAAAAAAEQRAQAPLEISQHIIQIVLRLLRSVPRVTFFPARVIPSHAICLVISSRA